MKKESIKQSIDIKVIKQEVDREMDSAENFKKTYAEVE